MRPDLGDLLRALHEIDGLHRLRFLTSYPPDMTERILRAVAELPKVCQHFSLPVQSGDDGVLERMRRGYTVAEYRQKLELLRRLMPEAAVSTDVIVGFCGETEAEFRRTYDLLAELRFDKVHVAAYSPRPGTIAWRRLPDDVPQEVKRERLQAVEELQARIAGEINSALLGRTVEVLVEEEKGGKLGGPARPLGGRTRSGKLVHFSGDARIRAGPATWWTSSSRGPAPGRSRAGSSAPRRRDGRRPGRTSGDWPAWLAASLAPSVRDGASRRPTTNPWLPWWSSSSRWRAAPSRSSSSGAARPPFRASGPCPAASSAATRPSAKAAARRLLEETGLEDVYLEQLYTFTDLDPDLPAVAVTYFALVNHTQARLQQRRRWRPAWHAVASLPELAFNNRAVIDYALTRLRYKLEYTNVAYSLLPESFTLSELQRVYESILGRPLDKRNFRKWILARDIVRPTGGTRSEGAHRPARLYAFTSRQPVIF